MRFFPFFFIFFLGLASCAYMTEGMLQDVRIETPGAHDAICYMYVGGTRYRVNAPQTIKIAKNKDDLHVDCIAPGNRRKEVFIEAGISSAVMVNAANGLVPGVAWDYASGAMYEYPAIITVDFTDAPVRPESLPAQNNPDIKQPEEYDLEEFRPEMPRLNEDKYMETTPILKRERPGRYGSEALDPAYSALGMGGGDATPGKGELMVVPSGIEADVNPAGAQSPAYGPAYPGQ